MGIRSTFVSVLSAPAARLLERDIRELVEDVLASRPVAHAAELEALRAEVSELRQARASDAVQARVEALEAELESVKKRLSMAMGAVQASTAQLMQVRDLAEEARAAAGQAGQHATSAKATAEAAVDGLTGLEERLDALVERLGTAPSDAGPSVVADAEPEAAIADIEIEAESDALCRLPGCTNKHRARGFCARHYQQFRRSTLEGVVGPDGVLPLDGQTLDIGAEHAGKLARRVRGEVLLEDRPLTR